MEKMIVETHQLKKSYGPIQAVAGIDLRVPAGCIYGFLGPNGAGKTTTIRMLLGLIKPSAGSISLYGKPIDRQSGGGLFHVGSLVESPSYYPHLTGRENVEIVRRLRGLPSKETERVLKVVGLSASANRLVHEYSQGMRQRLGLGMALLGNPDLIILDEPTNGLDPAGIHEIRELLRRLPAESGTTIFLSSHLLAEVECISSRIGILNHGKIILQGLPEELRNSYTKNVTVLVDAPEKALSALRETGWRSERTGDSSLQISIKDEDQAYELNAHLIGKGIKVFSLTAEQITLEQIFLQLTKPEKLS